MGGSTPLSIPPARAHSARMTHARRYSCLSCVMPRSVRCARFGLRTQSTDVCAQTLSTACCAPRPRAQSTPQSYCRLCHVLCSRSCVAPSVRGRPLNPPRDSLSPSSRSSPSFCGTSPHTVSVSRPSGFLRTHARPRIVHPTAVPYDTLRPPHNPLRQQFARVHRTRYYCVRVPLRKLASGLCSVLGVA
jgi:hypothetical protein